MSRYISDCSDLDQELLIEAARNVEPVSGLTHNFYRYPARFSPKFVKAAIATLSDPGDLVVDPFMGGGTTLVEALALGRDALGSDISSLAAFVSETKTTLLSESELRVLSDWATLVITAIRMNGPSVVDRSYEKAGYYRHMQTLSTWRLRKAIEQSLDSIVQLRSEKLQAFARCVVLRTSQWALDGRKKLPSVGKFRVAIGRFAREMIDGARELRKRSLSANKNTVSRVLCLNRSTVGLEYDSSVVGMKRPKLVLTSPPYPGIHVLYHRWQVDGRKETPAPFWIANRLDGDGASYYTMGDRKAHRLDTYFDQLRNILSSVAALCSSDTTVVQVMAFSQPSWQLPRYLSVADDVGLQEALLPALKGRADGRLWRLVPNRKWHADQKGMTHGSQEVVLFHKLRKNRIRRSLTIPPPPST